VTPATIVLILTVHFVADFMLQSDWMAQGKSKRFGLNLNMAAHIGVYSAFLLIFGPLFALVNGAAHYVTDAITSTATSYLWKAGKRHAFFVVIGFDQLAHYAVLFLTYEALTWL
jgi:hypothetical protein